MYRKKKFQRCRPTTDEIVSKFRLKNSKLVIELKSFRAAQITKF